MDQIKLDDIQKSFKSMKESTLKLIEYFNIYKDKPKEILYHLKVKNSTNDERYYEFIETLPSLIKQLDIICNDIDSTLDDMETMELGKLSSHYMKFIINEIVNFSWSQMTYLDEYTMKVVMDFSERAEKASITYTSEDHNALNALQWIMYNYDQHLSTLKNKISSIKIFYKIKDIDSNIVLIGANGSGKSTFARNLKGKLSDNTTILSAQHLLIYSNPEMVSRNNKELNSVYIFQSNDKLGSDPNLINFFKDDMNNLISALLKENADIAVECHKGHEDGKKSILNRVINIWESLVINRKLEYSSASIEVSTLDGKKYDFNCLSDGEKAIFYYTAHVLLAKKNSYIIVDEPDTHLHPAICNKLWDTLEQERSDCKFIYITHDLDFATSRNDKVILWNKKFEPPYTWEVERLNEDESIPERLLMEIIGSKKKILFCEGDTQNSIDFKLYSILFENHTIVPVGGHLNVINYCKAYNRNKSIYGQEAIGIIDRDCHSEVQIEKWEKDKIYTLEVNEIENLLCDEMILESAAKRFCCADNVVESFKNKFFSELKKDKEQQAVWYASGTVNNLLKANMLKEEKDLALLKADLKNIIDESLIQESYNKRLTQLEEFIDSRDYDGALKVCNFKNKLLGYIAREIIDGYKDRVITLIFKDYDLQENIKRKYFPMIEE